jgi:ADP-ribose pyrophosphatase
MALPRSKVFNGKLIKVYKSNRKLPNDKIGYFEEVEHPGAALIVPFLKGKIVLIKQYRAVIDKYIWELPAGKLDPGETPYSCAKREITEETGYKVKNLKKIGVIYTTPGFCDEVIHIYRADCVDKKDRNLDSDEIIDVELLSKAEIKKLFKTGKIDDAKTIAALAFAGII